MNADEARDLYTRVGEPVRKLRDEEQAAELHRLSAETVQTCLEGIKEHAINGFDNAVLEVSPACHATVKRDLERLGFHVETPSPFVKYAFVSWRAPHKPEPTLPTTDQVSAPIPKKTFGPTCMVSYMHGVMSGTILTVAAFLFHPFG